jgi:hypothetical protein
LKRQIPKLSVLSLSKTINIPKKTNLQITVRADYRNEVQKRKILKKNFRRRTLYVDKAFIITEN